MLVALTTGQRLAIAIVAAVFIAFALVSSFVLPARDPNFPGRRLGIFVAATAALFVAMMAAILIFAREEHEEVGEVAPAETRTEAEEEPETEPAAPVEGDAEAGRSLFASEGCGSCHVLQEAGSDGTIGPNLDETRPELDLIVDRVTNGEGVMPAFGDRLSDEQIRDVAAFVYESTRS